MTSGRSQLVVRLEPYEFLVDVIGNHTRTKQTHKRFRGRLRGDRALPVRVRFQRIEKDLVIKYIRTRPSPFPNDPYRYYQTIISIRQEIW